MDIYGTMESDEADIFLYLIQYVASPKTDKNRLTFVHRLLPEGDLRIADIRRYNKSEDRVLVIIKPYP